MVKANELQRWLATLSGDSFVAVDDGGLILVEVDAEGGETGACLEIGGIEERGG